MGLFLHLSSVLSAPKSKTISVLKKTLKEDGVKFEVAKKVNDDFDDLCIINYSDKNSNILFPQFFDHWEISKNISILLQTYVIAFEIHDGDFWFFVLYDKGDEILKFNPMPEYYDEDFSNEEITSWIPKIEEFCKYFPKVKPNEVENYFIHWKSNDINHWTDASNLKKAYPKDKYGYGNGLQLFDFIKKLDILYPIGDDGKINGDTFKIITENITPPISDHFEKVRIELRKSPRYSSEFIDINEKEFEHFAGMDYNKFIQYNSNTFYCTNCKQRHAVINPKSRFSIEVFLVEVFGSCGNCRGEVHQGFLVHDIEKIKNLF